MAKKTLKFKKTVCSICNKAHKRAMKAGEPYCSDKNPKIRNGHCTGFGTMKSKAKGEAKNG